MFPAVRIPQPTAEIALADWSVRSIDVRGRPIEVSCVEGEVLVTFEGDPEDHIVAAGHGFRAQGRGRLVVAALRPSTVRIAVV